MKHCLKLYLYILSWSIKNKSSALVRWSMGSVAESVVAKLEIISQTAKFINF